MVVTINDDRIIDNLPAATKKTLQDASGDTIEVYESGFFLGDKHDVVSEYYSLNNLLGKDVLFE